MYKIFIVEDDKTIASAMAACLNQWGYESRMVKDFSDVYNEFLAFNPQLVLMDISLPFYNGYYWCSQIRKVSKVPMIFISSQGEPMDMVMAMNMGADDYMTKPFDLNVLTAKVAALVRRTYDYKSDGQQGITFGKAFLNTAEAALYINNQRVDLTKNEFRILKLLLEHKNRLVSRDELMQALWESENFIDDNTLTVNVARLRRKLEQNGLSRCIETKKGLGYILNA